MFDAMGALRILLNNGERLVEYLVEFGQGLIVVGMDRRAELGGLVLVDLRYLNLFLLLNLQWVRLVHSVIDQI